MVIRTILRKCGSEVLSSRVLTAPQFQVKETGFSAQRKLIHTIIGKSILRAEKMIKTQIFEILISI